MASGSMAAENDDSGQLQIAVGVILDAHRARVLVARRPAHLRHGGMWEFPGGKQEPGESMDNALRRELREELNLHVVAARPFMRVPFDYPDVRVHLHVWVIDEWQGEPRGMQGQEHEWVPVAALQDRAFPEANLRIIAALQLPQLYLITPDLSHYGEEFFSATRSLLGAGVRLLQFRSRRLAAAERPQVLDRLASLCRATGARFMINGSAAEVLACGARGLHLTAARLMELEVRPLPRSFLIGASCHDAEELRQAEKIGADFAVLGPVARTCSHPGAPPLGWSGFTQLTGRGRQIPVFALGGLGPRDMTAAHQAGAWGLAMISAVWSAPNPEEVIGACLGRTTVAPAQGVQTRVQ